MPPACRTPTFSRSARSKAAGGLLRREPGPADHRFASRCRLSSVRSNVTTTNTAVTALPISPSASTWNRPRREWSRSPSGGRQKITPTACANSSMSTIQMPPASGLSRTTCRLIRPAPSMRHSLPPKPAAFCNAWSSPTTPEHARWLKYGRDRRGARPPAPGSQNRPAQAPRQRNRCMGATTKCRRRPHHTGVHDRKACANRPRLSHLAQRGHHHRLSPKVGDGGNRKGGISWGCLTPPLLHRRSDMPCPKITSSS